MVHGGVVFYVPQDVHQVNESWKNSSHRLVNARLVQCLIAHFKSLEIKKAFPVIDLEVKGIFPRLSLARI